MTTITIRNVPEETHAELVVRAEKAGQSLQEYLKGLLEKEASRPDMRILMARIRDEKLASGESLSTEKILEYRNADRP